MKPAVYVGGLALKPNLTWLGHLTSFAFYSFLLVGAKVEADKYCQRVLRARMEEGSITEAPIIDNVKGYVPSGDAARADGVALGFPCQASIS